jgi:hypothetical protein
MLFDSDTNPTKQESSNSYTRAGVSHGKKGEEASVLRLDVSEPLKNSWQAKESITGAAVSEWVGGAESL